MKLIFLFSAEKNIYLKKCSQFPNLIMYIYFCDFCLAIFKKSGWNISGKGISGKV